MLSVYVYLCYHVISHLSMLKDGGIFIKQTSPALLAEINRVVAAILKK